MSRKFDVVIGNPPYQEEAQGEGTRDTPVYHLFMDAAYEVARKAVLVTPARFLFNAGFTPKAWNKKMLADPRLTVPLYVPNSDGLFPGTTINGGIAVTYWDEDADGEPIGTFTSFPELNTILHKVAFADDPSIEKSVSSGRAYAYTEAMHDQNPEASKQMSKDAQFRVSTNAFEQLAFLYHARMPADGHEYARVLGLSGGTRTYRWIRREYITGPEGFDMYKVIVPASRGHLGTLGDEPALVIGEPLIGEPGVAVTQTFITIGAFKDEATAVSCLNYVSSKFARALLGVLKITQHNPAKVWKHVPLQDFTSDSDIDWTKTIPEIDEQLYSKYGLNDDEIAFIEEKVKSIW